MCVPRTPYSWSVGKTSLARRFAQGKFDENQFATVGGTHHHYTTTSTPPPKLFPCCVVWLCPPPNNVVALPMGVRACAAMHLHKVVNSEGSSVLVEIWYNPPYRHHHLHPLHMHHLPHLVTIHRDTAGQEQVPEPVLSQPHIPLLLLCTRSCHGEHSKTPWRCVAHSVTLSFGGGA
jgi:hypothetical protein